MVRAWMILSLVLFENLKGRGDNDGVSGFDFYKRESEGHKGKTKKNYVIIAGMNCQILNDVN